MPFPALPAPIAQALTARGYAEPTPVQALVLDAPPGDLLVSAATGSGKTVAFGLAFSSVFVDAAGAVPAPGAPKVLCVAPTRELALQVQRELGWLFGATNARIAACVGGMDPRREARTLQAGVHVVVGTPGRLCDHLDRGVLDLDAIGAVVLDEADEMLDMGFRDELERLLTATPKERRTLMFSATLPRGIEEIASRYQRDASRIAASAPGERHADIAYRAVLVAAREREHAVVNLLRSLDPSGTIVFCNTRDTTNHLASSLHERGFGAVALSGELTQAERLRALQALRDGRARVLVATDVAARGLDLPDLAVVIHADLPHDAQVLQHRSGRTGRAGKKGTAILLVPSSRRRVAERLCHEAAVAPEWIPVPTADDILARDQERLAEEVGTNVAQEAAEEDLDVGRKVLEGSTPEAVAAALVRLLRGRLPSPEDLPETTWLNRREQERVDRDRKRDEWRRNRDDRARPELPREPREPREAREPKEVREPREAREPRVRPPPDGGESVPERRVTRPRRPAVPEGESPEATRWFRVNVGRAQNADPRWLIPVICRRGHIEKGDIGTIRILDRETRFEVRTELAAEFDRNARRPDRKDPNIRFLPVED